MVAEVTPDYPSQWAAITAVAQKLGVGTAETLRKWVRRAEIDDGRRPGLTSQEHAEIKPGFTGSYFDKPQLILSRRGP
jgi:transposase